MGNQSGSFSKSQFPKGNKTGKEGKKYEMEIAVNQRGSLFPGSAVDKVSSQYHVQM